MLSECTWPHEILHQHQSFIHCYNNNYYDHGYGDDYDCDCYYSVLCSQATVSIWNMLIPQQCFEFLTVLVRQEGHLVCLQSCPNNSVEFVFFDGMC